MGIVLYDVTTTNINLIHFFDRTIQYPSYTGRSWLSRIIVTNRYHYFIHHNTLLNSKSNNVGPSRFTITINYNTIIQKRKF